MCLFSFRLACAPCSKTASLLWGACAFNTNLWPLSVSRIIAATCDLVKLLRCVCLCVDLCRCEAACFLIVSLAKWSMCWVKSASTMWHSDSFSLLMRWFCFSCLMTVWWSPQPLLWSSWKVHDHAGRPSYDSRTSHWFINPRTWGLAAYLCYVTDLPKYLL